MSGGVVCYIERTPGGGGIRRLRLIAAGLARQWTAPDAAAVSSIDAGQGSGPPGVNAAKAGATWIAETLQAVGLKRLAAICVDAEGSVCAWLSTTSPEQSVVRETLANAGAEGDTSTGVGAARLLTGSDAAGGHSSFTAEASVQALATLDPEQEPKGGLTLKRKSPVAVARKQRYAVISVQDAIVRVLLDELDARAIEVDRVVSIWHAMASGWDNAAPASISDRLVSAASTGGAVILVEPSGRLIWAWTRAGELVAGGAMRLAAHSKQARPADAAAPGTAREADLATIDAPTSVFAPAEEDRPSVSLEFSTAEAGRLSLDWLSWSAQLGHCPQRVVCLSAPSVCDSSPTRPMGPEALFAHLATRWPGATVDGAVHDDPIGATIARLAGLGPEIPARDSGEDAAPASVLPYHARPREALTELSRRPGRADRRLYQWIGFALIAAAVFIGVIGYKVRSSISSAEGQLKIAKEDRLAALRDAEKYSENVSKQPKPEAALEGALARVRDQAKQLKAPRPIIEEAANVFIALAGVNDNAPAAAAPTTPPPAPGVTAAPTPGRTQLMELEISAVAAKVSLAVPDASTGPDILAKLSQSKYVLNWQGNTTGSGANRTYLLTATWPENLTPAAPRPAAASTAPSASAGAAKPAPGATDATTTKP